MPQFNNFAYNALQFQPNNLSNGFVEPNRNINNHANAFFSFTNSNPLNNGSNISTNSPCTVLTPGRKSASPTFFHTNDSLYNRNSNLLENYLHSSLNNKHLNFGDPHIPFSNLNGAQLALSNNESALKIPTTPTRSKSLSPSHRCITQPARLRHKQQNKIPNLELNQISNSYNTKSRHDGINNFSNNENFLFQPIDNLNTKNQKSPQKLNKSIFLRNKLLNDKNSSKLNGSNEEIQIKKPISLMPTDKKTDSLQPNLLSENQQNNSKFKKTIEKDSLKIQNNFINKNSIEKKISKFKLPFNVRMINLKNYPPNLSSMSKRQFSIIMQRVKSENVNNSDKCIQILKQNVQFFFNQEIKQLVDKYRKSFIDPAVKNFNQNKNDTQISDDDVFMFILDLIENAKKDIIDSDDRNSQSLFSSIEPVKRKLDSVESSQDLTSSDISDESVSKKSKSLDAKMNLDCEEKRDRKEFYFNSETKFVLGKNVNDAFLQIQQQCYEANSDDSSNSATQSDSINPKSIYSRFPNLFRYGADQQDRQWLSENQIIKRKNIKCNILLLDDIYELFNNCFKMNYDDNKQELNGLQSERDLILKNLKTFILPEFILNKFKKNYTITNSKYI